MLATERLIQKIRAVLHQPEKLGQRELAELCRQFAEVCEQLNDRLLQAALYLRRGYRSEAVRLCSLDQNLLKLLTDLHFPGVDRWIFICQEIGINVPTLRFDLADEINRTFQKDDETREIAARLRRQYILRKPVEQRIATLEALQKVDPTNHIWSQNLDECRQENRLKSKSASPID